MDLVSIGDTEYNGTSGPTRAGLSLGYSGQTELTSGYILRIYLDSSRPSQDISALPYP
jgi:hypothetical protein